MITKKIVPQKIEIDIQSGVIRVTETAVYVDDGVETPAQNSCFCIEPGDDQQYSADVESVRKIFQTKAKTQAFLENRVARLRSSKIRGVDAEIERIEKKINDIAANK